MVQRATVAYRWTTRAQEPNCMGRNLRNSSPVFPVAALPFTATLRISWHFYVTGPILVKTWIEHCGSSKMDSASKNVVCWRKYVRVLIPYMMRTAFHKNLRHSIRVLKKGINMNVPSSHITNSWSFPPRAFVPRFCQIARNGNNMILMVKRD